MIRKSGKTHSSNFNNKDIAYYNKNQDVSRLSDADMIYIFMSPNFAIAALGLLGAIHSRT